MNQEQTNITTGKQIRHLRTQLGMTQEELAGELNVTRQALSNWERDVNEPDLNMLKKICFLFGVNMDDFAKEVITKMETYEKKEKRQFNKYDMAIGLFYGVGIFLGIGIFFVGGFMTMSGAGWGASLFGGGCFSLVFSLQILFDFRKRGFPVPENRRAYNIQQFSNFRVAHVQEVGQKDNVAFPFGQSVKGFGKQFIFDEYIKAGHLKTEIIAFVFVRCEKLREFAFAQIRKRYFACCAFRKSAAVAFRFANQSFLC